MAVIGTLLWSLVIVTCCIMNVEDPRSPFVWRDVAAVHLLCMLPFSVILIRITATDTGRIQPVLIGGTCWLAGAAALAGLIGIGPLVYLEGTRHCGFSDRQIVALLLLAPIAWVWRPSGFTRTSSHSEKLTWLFLTFVIANALPATYVTARCRQDATRFQELLGQSRLGEGLRLGRRIIRLDPDAQLDDGTVSGTARELEPVVQKLQSDCAVSPGHQGTSDEQFQQAQRLAMLGQTDEALRILNELPQPTAKAWNLAGTIHETREAWKLGLDAYQRAQTEWEATPASVERTQGRIRAVTGIAYCLRRQGHYHQAEKAYRKLLELAPNADSHFLLARFYQDSEQTLLAQEHARQAMELSPGRYLRSGKQLLNNLATSHFGCFKIWPSHSFRSASTSRYR